MSLFQKSVEKKAEKSPLGDLGAPSVLKSAKPRLYEKLENMAIDMRNNPTVAEKLLWEKLRNKQLGIKFRQQHVIDKFIVDFCSIKSALIIEVDGQIHDDQKESDEKRTQILENQGYTVIRFKNEEILNDIDRVLSVIVLIAQKAPQPPEGGVQEKAEKSPLGD